MGQWVAAMETQMVMISLYLPPAIVCVFKTIGAFGNAGIACFPHTDWPRRHQHKLGPSSLIP